MRAGGEPGDRHRPGERRVLRAPARRRASRAAWRATRASTWRRRSVALPANGSSSGVEQPGQGRLGQVAGEQRGDRDAELRAGELEGQLAQRVPTVRAVRSPASACCVDLGPVDRDQRELGGHEERVARGEQRRTPAAAPAPSAADRRCASHLGAHCAGRRSRRRSGLGNGALGCGVRLDRAQQDGGHVDHLDLSRPRRSLSLPVTPSPSMVLAERAADRDRLAPVASASSIRSTLIRLPIRSSIHIRAPPAPQQKERSALRGISVDRALGRRPRRRQPRAGRGEDPVVPAQVARVVVGDAAVDRLDRGELAGWRPGGPAAGCGARPRYSPPSCAVLVAEGVEAVRAGGDDLLRRPGLVQRLDVLLGQHLEDELVADPPGRVAGAGLALAEDREARRRPRAAAWRPRGWSSWPGPRTRRRSRPRTGTRSRRRRRPAAPRSPGPWSSPRGCSAARPTGCPCSPGCAASRRPRTGSSTRSAPGSGACRRCGRRARCRPGTARRRRRRWCRTTARPGR